ncbi:MAG: hypothetical protein EWV70_09535 [Microcystis flos-aquae Mf_QC_C_20070823_S20]|nr:MAG: hypothetical protein EWV70_09535 [Microcystis flos-aquae Mf_QC_C_20070823_S20]
MVSSAHDLDLLKDQLEGDLETLYRLVVTFGPPVSAADIRAASAILRRWLGENLLGQLCNQIQAVPSFPSINNTHAMGLVMADPRVDYFTTGGVKFAGVPVSFTYSSSAPGDDPLPLTPPKYSLLRTKAFLAQKRMFFEGKFFTTEEIIRFTANKLGGVHLDSRLNEREEVMMRAADRMTFGGPSFLAKGKVGEMHLELEPHSTQVLNGFHLEVVAAAASFIQLHLDGTQLAQLPKVKPKLLAKIFGTKTPKFSLSERSNQGD